jgi:transposase
LLLFPPSLDEIVFKGNLVRGIKSYVDILDVFKLGFNTKNSTVQNGTSAFHPTLLLKIYIYGYINKIRSKCFDISHNQLSKAARANA